MGRLGAPQHSTRRCNSTANAVRAPSVLQPPQRRLARPKITYSTCVRDVCVAELRQLYAAVHQHQALATGSLTQQSCFQHFVALADGKAEQKLQALLDGSVAVAAAFTRDPQLVLGASDASDAGAAQPDQSSSTAGLPWGVPLLPWGQPRPPRRLVGFVRASGDTALVATLHDLIVHPALQGYGLGSSLLARLVGQVSGGGVYDVGLVSPASLAPFFHSCSFDLDRESSEPMALLSSSALTSKDVHAINAPLQSSRSLLALLDSQLGTAGQPHERHAASQQLARHQ